MLQPTVYRGSTYFTDHATFCINRVEEAVKPLQCYHSHDFLEICCVCSGGGYHIVDGKQYAVAKGALFIIDYNVPHCFYRTDGSMPLTTYNLLFTVGFLDESLMTFHDFNRLSLSYLFRNIWEGRPVGEALHVPLAEQQPFEALIGNIHKEYTRQQSGFQTMIRGYLIQLITGMARLIDSSGARAAAAERESAIQGSLDYLQTHYAETISLSELAAKSFFSRSHFAKVFKETTGMSVSQYVNGIRMAEARRMLLHTEKKAADIAAEVGFSDYKAFYQTFKQYTGSTPRRYRLSQGAVVTPVP